MDAMTVLYITDAGFIMHARYTMVADIMQTVIMVAGFTVTTVISDIGNGQQKSA
jgi:hypothetical protein